MVELSGGFWLVRLVHQVPNLLAKIIYDPNDYNVWFGINFGSYLKFL